MKVTPLALDGVFLIEPRVFSDARGYFFESFQADRFSETTGVDWEFVQDNHSCSSAGVLRGLHYQLPPREQGKLIRVIAGSIFDVAVDIRPGSPTCGQWVGEWLTAENRQQMWVPPGFAHGFLALGAPAEVVYKTTAKYSPAHERCILWNDPAIGIQWPLNNRPPVLSPKDAAGVPLAHAELPDRSRPES